MVSSSALMASLKALLVSAGAVSIAAVALRAASAPSTSADPLAPRMPPALGSLLSWFRPPYLFVVVNGIILAIAATSRCFHRPQPEAAAPERIAVVEAPSQQAPPPPPVEAEAFDEYRVFEEKRVVVVEGNGVGFGGGDGYNGDCEGERKVAFGRSASTPRKRADSSEKAPVSPRLVRRKAANGDRLQVGKVSRKGLRRSNESMENVWKAIVEAGAAKPTKWPMKVDDADHRSSLLGSPPPPPSPSPSMQKSATFKDRAIQLRKELSPDELNHRVEAFINKFNEEMRLQKQESSNQFEEMISRGT
ncbi:uncharacterized protein LOC104441070 [Eucalyptus grandis]|uniref:uncharacterized protein LOC104441070 n=1 Tax=Eucalyptus grandis TaxID=71139 RepID=UPI00192E9A78|nr:uncharacterized protein LOC104441070 [Eucalyptus grandis]